MTKFRLYNTLTRTVENFKPANPQDVRMYTCGLTVYSQPQIGNWVAYIYSDVLTRALQASGLAVRRIQNITDVGHLVSDDDAGEDKMQKGARAEGKTAWQVADKYIAIAEDEAYTKLKLQKPHKLARATDLIPEQIAFVQRLEQLGYTYIIPGEGVYFDTSKLTDYGKLARLDTAGLQAGARVDIGGKQHPTDFALWKFSPTGEQRDMEWESPWGTGFPGWHLECSTIALENLGEQIDLHTGGIDHIPVHHTNEIAQTESATGKQFSRHWFHNNHMKVNGTKLSKSLGNSYTLADIEDKGFSLDAFKLLVLSSHYRTEGNFTWEILQAAQNRLQRWQSVADMRWQNFEQDSCAHMQQDVIAALQNDLDTPKVLSLIDAGFDELVASNSAPSIDVLRFIDNVLGINLDKPDITDEQKQLISQRQQVRTNKDWKASDELRDKLLEQGIAVKDTPNGAIWSRA
jgi:cysteinyl-tRNA synthetase